MITWAIVGAAVTAWALTGVWAFDFYTRSKLLLHIAVEIAFGAICGPVVWVLMAVAFLIDRRDRRERARAQERTKARAARSTQERGIIYNPEPD